MSALAHPSDGDLRALLDGELPASQATDTRQHVGGCAACRTRLAESEQSAQAVDALLSLLAPSASSLRLETVLHRARRGRARRIGLIAAAVTLMVAATAGATVARPFVRMLATRILAVVRPSARVSVLPKAPSGAQAGVAIVPGAVAEVVFDTTQAQGVVRVTLADTVELAIRSSAPVSYRVYPVGVVVHNSGSTASYDVVIPRAAPQVRIVVAGRVMLEKTGPHIVSASVPDSTGRYNVTLNR